MADGGDYPLLVHIKLISPSALLLSSVAFLTCARPVEGALGAVRGAVVELPLEGAVLVDRRDVTIRGHRRPDLLTQVAVLAGIRAPQA